MEGENNLLDEYYNKTDFSDISNEIELDGAEIDESEIDESEIDEADYLEDEELSFSTVLITVISVSLVMLVIILAGVLFFVNSRASSPEKTMKKLYENACNDDFYGMIECFSPGVKEDMRGLTDIFNLYGLNREQVAQVFTFDIDNVDCKVLDIDYSGGKYEKIPLKNSLTGKLFAKKAEVVYSEIYMGEQLEPQKLTMGKYGESGWLIEDNLIFDFSNN